MKKKKIEKKTGKKCRMKLIAIRKVDLIPSQTIMFSMRAAFFPLTFPGFRNGTQLHALWKATSDMGLSEEGSIGGQHGQHARRVVGGSH